MTTQEKLIKSKLSILELGEYLKNVSHNRKILHSIYPHKNSIIEFELNRYAELLYKRLTEEFYPARQFSFLA